ncbi:hypothetical protein E8E11_006071 [Didymella keratinophila]|nr:hypothetical protein E8E11_006071 [Didymella keratinophila]
MSFPRSASRDDITQRDRITSPLLRLPAELRNQIYMHAFGPYDILIDKLDTNDKH